MGTVSRLKGISIPQKVDKIVCLWVVITINIYYLPELGVISKVKTYIFHVLRSFHWSLSFFHIYWSRLIQKGDKNCADKQCECVLAETSGCIVKSKLKLWNMHEPRKNEKSK